MLKSNKFDPSLLDDYQIVTDFWGNIATGILPINKETCKFALQHRSGAQVGNTWSVFGGAVSHKGKDRPISTKSAYNLVKNKERLYKELYRTIKNELHEETGSKQKISKIKEVDLFDYNKDKPNRPMFRYYTFVGVVGKQFEYNPLPEHAWESDKITWLDYDSLIHFEDSENRFHPGFRSTINKESVQNILKEYHEKCLRHQL